MNMKISIIILLLLTTACQPSQVPIDNHNHATLVQEQEPGPNQALISIFLAVPPSGDLDVVMDLQRLEILNGDVWLPILDEVRHLEALEIGKGQIFLARAVLEPGNYSHLRVTLAGASMKTSLGQQPLNLTETSYEYSFPNSLELGKGDSDSLFISWDPFQSIMAGDRFSPMISIANQSIPLNKDLAYVACPKINTIYILDTEKNRIVGSWSVPGHPTDISLFQDRLELFVLSPDQGVIRVIEVPTGRIKDVIKLPMVMKPSFMLISPDADSAFVLDEKSDMLYHFDLGSGSLSASLAMGDKPEYVEYIADSGRLAVSSPESGKVFLVETAGLSIVDTISLSGAPDGLLAHGDFLYIAEMRGNAVAEYSLSTGQIRRIFVGRTPKRLLAGEGYIYVANHGQGSVSLFQSGRGTISRSLRTGGAPLEMAVSLAREWIYVCDQRGGVIDVIDLTTKKYVGHIDLMAEPSGIAMSH